MPRPIASLETIPVELRKLIYRHCCSHHEDEIFVMPTEYETSSLLRDGRKLPKKPIRTAQLIENIRYDPEWPAVALLGVSRMIRFEVLPILFGMNTWRLSYQWSWPKNHHFPPWPPKISGGFPVMLNYYFHHLEYSQYFGHVSCHFNAQDMPQEYLVEKLRDGPEPDSTRDMMSGAHAAYINWLTEGPMLAKIFLIDQMENLERLHIGLASLACPGGCCRALVFKSLVKKWKAGMQSRLSKWGSMRFFRGCGGLRSYRVYIKGENRKLLAVYGLWSMKEVGKVSKHWCAPVQRRATVGRFRDLFREIGPRTLDEFFANIEPENKPFASAMST